MTVKHAAARGFLSRFIYQVRLFKVSHEFLQVSLNKQTNRKEHYDKCGGIIEINISRQAQKIRYRVRYLYCGSLKVN